MDIDQKIKFAIGEAIVQAAVNEHRAEAAERRVAELEDDNANLKLAVENLSKLTATSGSGGAQS